MNNVRWLVLSCALVLCLASNKKGEDKSVTNAREPEVTVSADDLDKDYQANEVGADNKYKGKILLVTGEVKEIKKDFTDDIVVYLGGRNLLGIGAYVSNDDAGKAGSLQKGQQVSLLCKGDGMTMGSPTLKGCRLK